MGIPIATCILLKHVLVYKVKSIEQYPFLIQVFSLHICLWPYWQKAKINLFFQSQLFPFNSMVKQTKIRSPQTASVPVVVCLMPFVCLVRPNTWSAGAKTGLQVVGITRVVEHLFIWNVNLWTRSFILWSWHVHLIQYHPFLT